MDSIIISPSKYIQGEGAINNIAKYAKKRALVIADDFVMGLIQDKVKASFASDNVAVDFELFNGECSKVEIARLQAKIDEYKSEIIIGVGGGKTLDTAKAMAFYTELPLMVVPTIASSDAPCSALSVLYTEDSVFDQYLLLPSNPNIVLMDTDIISKAPTRLLVSGMGDALATYFEARATAASLSETIAGGKASNAALALARLCYDTLIEQGYLAKLAADVNVPNKALDNIVEANTYLSGIGFESGGLAAAHAIHNGLTLLEECHHLYHGEKVAFGTLTQLVLENAPMEEIQEVYDFCRQVGLPTTFEEMGITTVDKDKLLEVAKLATAEGETIHNMPFPVTAESVFSALMVADSLGKA